MTRFLFKIAQSLNYESDLTTLYEILVAGLQFAAVTSFLAMARLQPMSIGHHHHHNHHQHHHHHHHRHHHRHQHHRRRHHHRLHHHHHHDPHLTIIIMIITATGNHCWLESARHSPLISATCFQSPAWKLSSLSLPARSWSSSTWTSASPWSKWWSLSWPSSYSDSIISVLHEG